MRAFSRLGWLLLLAIACPAPAAAQVQAITESDLTEPWTHAVAAVQSLASVSAKLSASQRAELERRLRARGTDTGQVIQRRLADAAADMTHWREFDYVVVNDDFERATAELADIVRGGGEKARSSRPGLAEFVSKLTGEPSPG